MALILVACSEGSPIGAGTEGSPTAESLARRLSESAGAVERVEDTETPQFVVYFGSFADGMTAFRYAFELPGASVERTAKGRFLIVTVPMDQRSAHDLAEWTGGRVLTTERLRKLLDGS